MNSEMEREVSYVIDGGGLFITKVGGLEFPEKSTEAQRCLDIKAILEDYSTRQEGSKPLSVAVFGPPGSGKSRCVKEITGSLAKKYTDLCVVNISQLSDAGELTKAIQKGIKLRKKGRTPIFFFDEFDAPLKEASLGWLRWFLAPMEDGEILDDGNPVKIGKTVFMFAGGTAASLSEFEERARLDPVAFREKKVPDFISRLRGFIDIQGINNQDNERKVRRALLLRFLLDERWPLKRDSSGRFPIDPRLVESLLSNVHFRHGVRSMKALVEMSRLEDGGKVRIPETELTKLHLSRGVLDGKVIGISAGLIEAKAGYLLAEMTGALLRDGAKLAYGGDFFPKGTLEQIVQAAKGAAEDLFDRGDKRVRNYLGFPSYLRDEVRAAQEKHWDTIRFFNLETLSRQEIRDLDLKDGEWFRARPENESETYQANRHLAWAISLFRMRVRLVQDINALIVFGGKDGESWGRFPGIAEEVMLALAFGKPVYIVGGLGGAARAVGKLLGLDETIANRNECLKDVKPIIALCPPKFRRVFAVPNCRLPETIGEMRDYFFQHALTTKAWPWNGLNDEENRELFCAEVPSECGACRVGPAPTTPGIVDTIVKGLSRLHWKRPASRQQQ